MGRQSRFPRRLQGLADQRLPRSFRLGGNPQRTLRSAATCGNPGASPRHRLAIETERASESPSVGRWERCHPIDARGVFPTMVLGHPPHREQPGIPGLAPQVLALAHGSAISPWRGAGPSLVEAEARPLAWLPGDVLPGRHQGLGSLWVGAWPRTHHGPLQDTGPTSASPGHYAWPWLLRASSSPTACGGCRRREVTVSRRAVGGSPVPSSHGAQREGGALHRGSRQCRPVRREGCRRPLLCHVGSRVSAACAGAHARWLGTPSLALPIEACETGDPA